MPGPLLKRKLDRLEFAKLAIGSVEPGGSTPAFVQVPAPPDGWVIVPTQIKAHSQMVGISGLLASLKTAVLNEFDDRYITISRTDAQENPVEGATVKTPMVLASERDLVYEQQLEVAAVAGVDALNGKGFRIEFNAINQTYERQYILLNYKVIQAADEE